MTNIAQGVVKTKAGKSLHSIAEVLKEQAKCEACGCDNCLGYETIIDAKTGALLIRYYSTTDGTTTQVVKAFDEGLAEVKALYAARQ